MKKKHRGEDQPKDIGRVMTVSLFLILLTFFILLNSIAVMDDKKTRAALGSLMGAFGGLPGGQSSSRTGDALLLTSSPMMSEESDIGKLMSAMNRKKQVDEIKFHQKEGKDIIVINDSVLFEKKGLDIKPAGYPILNNLGEILRRKDCRLEIVGHTDNRPAAEKGYASNWELSALKAIQVMRYLLEKTNVVPANVTALGNGGYHPMASNDTRQSRSQNNRVEIVMNRNASTPIRSMLQDKESGFITYENFEFKID